MLLLTQLQTNTKPENCIHKITTQSFDTSVIIMKTLDTLTLNEYGVQGMQSGSASDFMDVFKLNIKNNR